MKNTLKAFESNQTWIMIDFPPGKRPIDCKYIYKIKYNLDDNI
jgi:hypothetical protein